MKKTTGNKKKVKQVASRAKRTPRTDANTGASFTLRSPTIGESGTGTIGEALEIKALANKLEQETHEDFELGTADTKVEFSTEPHSVLKTRAIESSKKVDLRREIKTLVTTFRDDIDTRLKSLSERIESQLKPLVQSVTEVAMAKAELTNRLADFEESLSVTLNLNDELEPIDISMIFAPDTALDEEMSTYVDASEPDEITALDEATSFANENDVESIN